MLSLTSSSRVSFRRPLHVLTASHSFRKSFSSASDTASPLSVIQGAIDSLKDASSQLTAISDKIQDPLMLQSGQQVTFKDLVLHTRDSHPNDFHSPAAVHARSMVLPIAESLETSLKSLSQQYTTQIAPQMEHATRICQETPCGGASWEVDFSVPETLRVEGMDTPCGRLQTASMEFSKHTYKTKQDVILASRAALIMRLAMELNAPLTLIHQEGEDEQKTSRIRVGFQEQVVPTPWLRTEEEYKQLFEIESELNTDKKDE